MYERVFVVKRCSEIIGKELSYFQDKDFKQWIAYLFECIESEGSEIEQEQIYTLDLVIEVINERKSKGRW